ncbi:hypothetical protein HD806DRAFT_466689 [Xylariaceae sp. AK1471]|nr:hypothetical protein HD806DRAFT_466689 [Xylariaceae sp. AK1471]
MSHKAPSAGTKVTKNAPIKQEAPGPVPPDSLAAESQTFRQANSIDDNNNNNNSQQSRPQEGAHAPGTSKTHSRGTSMHKETGSRSVVEPAPTYVNIQYYRDPHPPHGKNIKEDPSIGTEDTAKNVSFTAEIGSKDDPSLLAERVLSKKNFTVPGSLGGREKTVNDKTEFDVLDTDQEAP